MKNLKRAAAILMVLLLAAGTAAADTLSLNGKVEAGTEVPVYAPIGGTVGEVSVEAGMSVEKGDALYSYRTEKIYASEDGTVTGVFVQAGDDAEKATEVYGADLYIEGMMRYTISASTSKAYSSADTTFIHAGEKVYVVCRNDSKRKGTGIVTAVDGANYTVLVADGNFVVNDSVSIYRDEAMTDKQRVGRGTASRLSPTAVNGTGAVVSVAVKDGDTVKRGDLLMETLTGTFDAYDMTGTTVTADEAGVITSITAEAGTTVAKGDVVAKIAPTSSVRVAVSLAEDDRNSLKAGDRVTIELDSDESKTYEGTVRYIADAPEEGEDKVTYKAVIDFTPDGNVCLGMAVVVTAKTNSDTMGTGE
jgi:multidrug resistance efflux pump